VYDTRAHVGHPALTSLVRERPTLRTRIVMYYSRTALPCTALPLINFALRIVRSWH